MPQPLSTHLTALENSGLIRASQAEADLEYIFRHVLIQDAVYESLLKTDRKRLHSAVAEAIERVLTDQLSELAPALARHFLLAENKPRALYYFALAGDFELRRFANAEAELHYRAALELNPDAQERARLLANLGETLLRQSQFSAADQVWRSAIESYQALNDWGGVARMYARAARTAGTTYGGSAPRALSLCREGLAGVSGQPESPALAMLLHEAGRASFFNGLLEEAQAFCQQALKLAEQFDDVEIQAETLATLWGLLPAHSPEAALAGLQKAARLAESAHRLDIASRIHHNLGFRLGLELGELAQGRTHIYQAVELLRRVGDEAGQFYSLDIAIILSFLLGEFAEVEKIIRQLKKLLPAVGNRELGALSLVGWEAWLLRCQSEWPAAREKFAVALAGFRQHEQFDTLGNMNCTLAELCLELGDVEAAEAAVRESLELAERGFMEPVEPQSLWVVIQAAKGNLEAAHQTLAQAQAYANAHPGLFNGLLSQLAQARLAAIECRWPEALATFEAAHGQAVKHHLRWYTAQTLREWADAHLSRHEVGDVAQARQLFHQATAEFETMHAPKYAALMRTRIP